MATKEKQEEILIVNRRTGKVLQAAGTDDGAMVVQSAMTGEDAQLWTPVKVGKQMKLVNKASGRVLDVMHGAVDAGTWVHVWEDVGGESQLWQWVRVTSTYKKLMNVHSGKVLDIVDMRDDDGAPTQIWDDVDGAGQQWKAVKAEVAAAKKAKADAPKAAKKPTASRKKAAPVEEKPKRMRKSTRAQA